MKKLIFILGIILVSGCTTDNYSFEPMRVSGLIDTWESGVENSFYLSNIITGGSGYYTCELASNAELPAGVAIGGYDSCEISGTITLNPGTSKLITPPFLMIVTDDYGNSLNVSVSLTIIENPISIYGNNFECIVGQACNKALVEIYEKGTEPYTYRLSSMAYGTIPPGTSVGIDGRITGTPTLAGEYSFEICVIDAENIISCSYSGINVVNHESELGQNWLYQSYEDEKEEDLPKLKITVLKTGSALASHSLMYIEDYYNLENCTENECVAEFPQGSYITIRVDFLQDTYFDAWKGIECEYEVTHNYDENYTRCSFELTENITITAIFNKRPTVHVTNFDCVFDRYHPNEGTAIYENSKIWGYHHLIFSGTASTGTVDSVLEISAGGNVDTEEGAQYLDCGAWTKEMDEYGNYGCVRKATDPDSTNFSLTVNDFEPQGHLLPFGGYALIEENAMDAYVYASDSGSDACDYE